MKGKAFGTLVGALLFLLGTYVAVGESERPRILRPLDKSVLPPGPVEIAVIVPSGSDVPPVSLDGKKLRLSPPFSSGTGGLSASPRVGDGIFLPPALIFVRSLSPGLHKLSAGGTTVQFFVSEGERKLSPPGDWFRYTPHPPAESEGITCVGCHEFSKERRFVNMNSAFSLEKPTGCFDCHERSEFNLTHNHRYESLAFCQMCHDPHGAGSDHLLKIPEEKACAVCHD